MEQQVSFLIAFLAGLGSFFSPCILPLLPVYILFITGMSIDNLKNIKYERKKIIREIILFVLGFSFVFIALGASAGSLGKFIVKGQRILMILGGAIIILFGFHLTGLLKIKYLEYEKRIQLKNKPLHMFGSFIIGITFALGWTPCIGPILGSILAFAATQSTLYQGVLLLTCYSIGLAIPFIVVGIAGDKILRLFSKAKKYLQVISVSCGILFVIAGAVVIFNALVQYSSDFEIERKYKPVTVIDEKEKPAWGNAPDFTLTTIEGDVVTLSNFIGKVVILDFWATWCPPCRDEIPGFIELYNEYKDKGAVIVGISVDKNINIVKRFAKEISINYPVVIGNQKIIDDYGGIEGIPTTFVINRKGDIKEKIVGYRPKEVFESAIKKYISD